MPPRSVADEHTSHTETSLTGLRFENSREGPRVGKKSRKGSQSRVALNSAGRSGPHPQRAATWADRWQAWGSVVAASVAILALIVSIISIAIQIAAYRAEQDSRNLEYASRVSIRLIRENGDFVIENRSTAPLQYVTLTYAELTAGTPSASNRSSRREHPCSSCKPFHPANN